MAQFERKLKYLVLKLDDIDAYISENGKDALKDICAIIKSQRKQAGKTNHGYVVVADDEPYVEEVWKLIREHERNQGASK